MLRPPVNGGNDLLREADDEKDDEEEEVPSVGQCSTRELWGRGPVLRLGLLLLFPSLVLLPTPISWAGAGGPQGVPFEWEELWWW
jgi:hypothetical protein